MYPITTELRDYFLGENPQRANITLTPVSGNPVIIKDVDIVQGTFYVNRACTASESLELGSCIASEFGCTLFNDGGKFDGVNFEGAELYVEIGDGTTLMPMGYFTIDDAPKVRDTITIVALDRMMFFDAEVKDSTIKGANRTIKQYIDRMCTVCGVTCYTNVANLPNYNYVVPKFPDEVGITYRQLLSWCCQIMGVNAYVDWQGLLHLEFPTTQTIRETITETERFSSDIEDYTVTTTGVYHIDGEEHETIYGTEDYAFDVSGNGLLQNPTIIQNLSSVVGITYTPFTATTVPYPWLMPMDYVKYQKNGTDHISILTSVTFHLNGHTDLASVGESQKARSYARRGAISSATRLVLERTVAELNTEIDTAMDEAVLQATQLITSTSGGYVVLHDKDNDGHVDEILIMDTEDISTATKVWRWNENGLGYSSTGYNGTYGLAMTANGQIVADFITTGTMNVSRIGGNIANGNWKVDFDNGTLTIGDISANNITAGTITGAVTATNLSMTGGSINVATASDSSNVINLSYGNNYTKLSPKGIIIKHGSNANNNNLVLYDRNDNQVLEISGYGTGAAYSSESDIIMGNAEKEDLIMIRADEYTGGKISISGWYPSSTVNTEVASLYNYYNEYESPIVSQGRLSLSNTANLASISLKGEDASIFLRNGNNTKSITITPTSNVATLQYTVVSTF